MKKILLLTVVMFAFSVSATTVKDYVTNDLTAIKGKTTDTNTTVSAMYKDLEKYISTVNVNDVKTKISNYCSCVNTIKGCKEKGVKTENFTYPIGGKMTPVKNALVLYTSTTPKGTEVQRRWFILSNECKDFTDLTVN